MSTSSPHLTFKLRKALGNEAGDELVRIVDRAANEVTELRGDVAELRHQMAVGFERVDTKLADMRTVIESEMRKQTQFFFLAWAVILAAIVGLYARG